MLSFSPRSITKNMLAVLPERSREVLVARFGLNADGKRQTLESIGQIYGITRERVRQIENHGLSILQTSPVYIDHQQELSHLEEVVHELGGIIAEETMIEKVPKTKSDQNHVLFLLAVGAPFTHERENAHFVRRWHVNPQLATQVQSALLNLSNTLNHDDLIPEDEFVTLFANHLKQEGVKRYKPETPLLWLTITKRIGRNPLGEWGRADSPHVRVKSMRDYAYLTLKRHGSPMHFIEVADAIGKNFQRKAHPATCHNELIKDERFVLVGRGLYALCEWGYAPGVVREVIKEVLRNNGALTREEIIDRVKRERYVKDATVIVNLQDATFRRTPEGRYELT